MYADPIDPFPPPPSTSPKNEPQEWLFAFHRSLAVIVNRLVGHGGGHHQQQQHMGHGHALSSIGGGGGGGYYRPGGGGGGLLSSRNNTSLMMSRRGLRVGDEAGQGHGRALSGAQRFRQVRVCVRERGREGIVVIVIIESYRIDWH